MLRTASALGAAATLFAGAVALSGPAAAADSYPDTTPVQVGITLDEPEVVGGDQLTATATGTAGNAPVCGTLSISGFGVTKSDSGTSTFTVTLDTPEVDERTVETITATIVATGCSIKGAATTAVGSATATADVTLLPEGAVADGSTDTSGGLSLPDTGGAPVGLIGLGAGLVVAGGAALVVARRRAA